ncbi:lipopolysaccharide biosynthesis protein [Phaeocystidibacter luteus]|uniref:Lipopolysaccharide biosynthesis protein n=1 Tax=Phaeocystidibacter luteus TaxID=911197 RepID=A0A6N6RHI5_9FLAO|nr:lipopolysaccharide biosynthesis protein [Phaeocystidibacter luteus]KAB2809779.1 lipopolysaccharide biosynthesis protein [Phaeocystidibacter luteus]
MERTVKQSFLGTLVSYFGIVMGMLNRIVLFPLVFVGSEADLWGLIELFIVYATVISSVSNLGRSKVIQRYLPGFKGDTKSLLAFAWRGTLLGTVVTFTTLLLLKNQVAALADDPGLFSEYYWVFLLILLGMTFFEWSSGILISKFRTHIPMVFNQFILRLYTLIALLLKWLDILTAVELLYVIAIGYVVVFGVMFFYAKKTEPRMTSLKVENLPDKKKINDFGLFSMVNGSSFFLFQHIDAMVMGGFSLVNVAFLTVAKSIANVFFLPGRSLIQSLSPVVSKAFQEEDFEKLERVYKKSSGAQLFVGGFIFLFIWANLDVILLPIDKFAGGESDLKWVVFLLGVGRLVFMSTGVSSLVLSRSKYYRFAFVANVSLIGVSVAAMLILIPMYGILGAAIAQGGVMVLNSVIRIVFIRRKLDLSPYTASLLPTALIITTVLAALAPSWFDSLWLSFFGKNALALVALFVCYRFFPPIDDLSNLVGKVTNRFKKKIK